MPFIILLSIFIQFTAYRIFFTRTCFIFCFIQSLYITLKCIGDSITRNKIGSAFMCESSNQ